MPTKETTIDLRALSCQQRHGLVLQCVAALEPGFALIIVNDHNPEPLRQQLVARFGDRFDWRLNEKRPGVFEARIHLLDTTASSRLDNRNSSSAPSSIEPADAERRPHDE